MKFKVSDGRTICSRKEHILCHGCRFKLKKYCSQTNLACPPLHITWYLNKHLFEFTIHKESF